MKKVLKALNSIIGSQKAIVTGAGALAVTFGATQQLNNVILVTVGSLFGLLVAAQAILDWKYGSKSDGTGDFAE